MFLHQAKRAPLSSGGGLDCNDVDLRHRHHRIHSPPCAGLVMAFHRLQQGSRRDLPGEAPPVSTPATRAFLPVVVDVLAVRGILALALFARRNPPSLPAPSDRVPIPVGLGLVIGQHHKADGLVWEKVRSTVETHE